MFILKILCCTELRDPYFYVYIDIIIKEAYMYIILACQFWRGCEGGGGDPEYPNNYYRGFTVASGK